MLSAAGHAVLFFMTLILGVIVGVYMLAYAAHCFLTVLQGTAAGLDEVSWPDEPILDWLRQAAHLIGLAIIWLVPPGFLWRALRHGFFPDDGLLRFLVILGPVFWLTFPVGVLSSLSGTLQWVPLRWTIVRQMVRLFPATAGFYVSTAFLVVLAAVPWYLSFSSDRWFVIPVAAVVSGAAVLIYPRLLGRLAWHIGRSLPAPKEPKPKFPVAGAGPKKKLARRRRKGRFRAMTVEDPWKVPDDFEPDPPPPKEPRNPNLPPLPHEIEGYGISTGDDAPEPWPLPKRRPPASPRGERPPDSPYEVEGYELDPEPPVKPVFHGLPEPPEPAEPPPFEEEETESVEPPAAGEAENGPAPRPRPVPGTGQKLPEGVWNFPAYSTSLQAWIRLSAGWFVLGMVVQQIVSGFRTLPE